MAALTLKSGSVATVIVSFIAGGCGVYTYDNCHDEQANKPCPTAQSSTTSGPTAASSGSGFSITGQWDLLAAAGTRYVAFSVATSPPALFAVNASARQIQTWDISTGTPTAGQPVNLPWKPGTGNEIGAWDGRTYWRGTDQVLIEYAGPGFQQGTSLNTTVRLDGANRSGGFISAGTLYSVSGMWGAVQLWKTDLPTGSQVKVWVSSPGNLTQLNSETNLDPNAGVAQLGDKYFLIAEHDTYPAKGGNVILVTLDSNGVAMHAEALTGFLGQGESVLSLSGDGVHLWLLSTSRIWKIKIN